MPLCPYVSGREPRSVPRRVIVFRAAALQGRSCRAASCHVKNRGWRFWSCVDRSAVADAWSTGSRKFSRPVFKASGGFLVRGRCSFDATPAFAQINGGKGAAVRASGRGLSRSPVVLGGKAFLQRTVPAYVFPGGKPRQRRFGIGPLRAAVVVWDTPLDNAKADRRVSTARVTSWIQIVIGTAKTQGRGCVV